MAGKTEEEIYVPEYMTQEDFDELVARFGEEMAISIDEHKGKAEVSKLRQVTKQKAEAMVGENGKYGKAYAELEAQLDALWQKAFAEASKETGLAAIEAKK